MADQRFSEPYLYLASASPRRSELLKQFGINFELIKVLDVDEAQYETETPEQYVSRLAKEKAVAGYTRLTSSIPASSAGGRHVSAFLVLGADTCIELDEAIIGKPANREDGIAMLKRLSGRSHRVLTAICLFDGNNVRQALSRSTVFFKPLKIDEIEQYWETGEPADKAGAYAIQGYAARFVADLHGSFSGVVGLPLYELSELLAEVSSSD
ncbi:MAG: nucleoside triphosphate pyrophosphatase [Gammaproteobacteria bacterium]|nr:MAG: nucleoside triphosphate pyrophosphatase [Gammaproteobacteria bacterium]